jgi:hypothetical protein
MHIQAQSWTMVGLITCPCAASQRTQRGEGGQIDGVGGARGPRGDGEGAV